MSDKVVLSEEDVENAVSTLQQLIRFETISASAASNGQYKACGNWLVEQLKGITVLSGVEILKESLPTKPLVVATWVGSDPSLPSLLLNSHYDVVPINPAMWTVPAFEGLRIDGKIYGRGSQVCFGQLLCVVVA
jgi:aminoacylase